MDFAQWLLKAYAMVFYAIIISINSLSLDPVPDVFMILTQRSMSLTVINFEKRIVYSQLFMVALRYDA